MLRKHNRYHTDSWDILFHICVNICVPSLLLYYFNFDIFSRLCFAWKYRKDHHKIQYNAHENKRGETYDEKFIQFEYECRITTNDTIENRTWNWFKFNYYTTWVKATTTTHSNRENDRENTLEKWRKTKSKRKAPWFLCGISIM